MKTEEFLMCDDNREAVEKLRKEIIN